MKKNRQIFPVHFCSVALLNPWAPAGKRGARTKRLSSEHFTVRFSLVNQHQLKTVSKFEFHLMTMVNFHPKGTQNTFQANAPAINHIKNNLLNKKDFHIAKLFWMTESYLDTTCFIHLFGPKSFQLVEIVLENQKNYEYQKTLFHHFSIAKIVS